MRGKISCKNRKAFQITSEPFTLDFKSGVQYYLEQGCIVEIVNDSDAKFEECGCNHCKSLKHNAPFS